MQRLGPYLLLEELARGGQATVFRARREGQLADCALKVLQGGAALPELARRRLLREAEALGRLRHPAVVRVLEAGEADGVPWLALELVPGESLASRLERQGPLPEREAAALVQRVAEGLRQAHAQGLIHRDVKPANVLLDPQLGPRLTDFGLVRVLDPERSRLSLSGQFLGTPGYWAPEQLGGRDDEVGPATDVYGLGATLYALLTGRPPRAAESLIEALDQAAAPLVRPRQLRPGLDPGLERVVLRCLESEPRRRYASAQELSGALVAWLSGRATRRTPRRAVLLAGLLLGSAALSVVGAWSWQTRRRAEVSALLDRAAELLQQRHTEDAAPLVERARQLAPDSAEVVGTLGVLWAERGDKEQALRYYGRALELDPDLGPILGNRGLLYLEQGRLAEARADLERSAELLPEDVRAWVNLLELRLALGDPATARDAGERATALDPAYAPASEGLARARAALGDAAGALQELERSLALHPEHSPLWERRGLIELDAGDVPAAERSLARAAELAPDQASPRVNWCGVLVAGNRFAEAEAVGQRAMALPTLRPSERSHLLRLLALIAMRGGDLPLARERWEAYLDVEPGRAACWIDYGVVLARLGQFAQAEQAFHRALELDASLTLARKNRGRARLQLGQDLEGAEADLRQSLLEEPDDGQGWYLLGELLLDRDPAEAERALRHSLTLLPVGSSDRRQVEQLLEGLEPRPAR